MAITIVILVVVSIIQTAFIVALVAQWRQMHAFHGELNVAWERLVNEVNRQAYNQSLLEIAIEVLSERTMPTPQPEDDADWWKGD